MSRVYEDRIADLMHTIHDYHLRCEAMAKHMDGMEKEFYSRVAIPVSHGAFVAEAEYAPNRIATALETNGRGAASGVNAAIPPNPYASPGLPEGFNTVLGYLAEVNPEALDLMGDPVADTQRDGYWLKHQASRRDIQIVSVEAPAPLKDVGIETVNAYPIELLRKRLGD